MEIKFWKVGCADAITIRYADSNGIFRNVFIDGGYVGTYRNTIKKELLSIEANSEKVDLWVITHTDSDHIGAVGSFVKDSYFALKQDIITQYWFNWSDYKINLPSPEISVSQGIRLRDYLLKSRADSISDIIAGMEITLHDSQFTILSPNDQRLEKSKIAWSEEEAEKMISAGSSDYEKTVEEVRGTQAVEDNEVFNGSSIAFLFRQGANKMLFLADSHPSVVVKSLATLGYSRENKLDLSFVKLSHHGSSGNLNDELIAIIRCRRFIILGNGIKHNLPNKATLVSILTHPERNYSETIEFLFSEDSQQLRDMFSIDNDAEIKRLNFRCVFNSSDFFSLTFSS